MAGFFTSFGRGVATGGSELLDEQARLKAEKDKLYTTAAIQTITKFNDDEAKAQVGAAKVARVYSQLKQQYGLDNDQTRIIMTNLGVFNNPDKEINPEHVNEQIYHIRSGAYQRTGDAAPVRAQTVAGLRLPGDERMQREMARAYGYKSVDEMRAAYGNRTQLDAGIPGMQGIYSFNPKGDFKTNLDLTKKALEGGRSNFASDEDYQKALDAYGKGDYLSIFPLVKGTKENQVVHWIMQGIANGSIPPDKVSGIAKQHGINPAMFAGMQRSKDPNETQFNDRLESARRDLLAVNPNMPKDELERRAHSMAHGFTKIEVSNGIPVLVNQAAATATDPANTPFNPETRKNAESKFIAAKEASSAIYNTMSMLKTQWGDAKAAPAAAGFLNQLSQIAGKAIDITELAGPEGKRIAALIAEKAGNLQLDPATTQGLQTRIKTLMTRLEPVVAGSSSRTAAADYAKVQSMLNSNTMSASQVIESISTINNILTEDMYNNLRIFAPAALEKRVTMPDGSFDKASGEAVLSYLTRTMQIPETPAKQILATIYQQQKAAIEQGGQR